MNPLWLTIAAVIGYFLGAAPIGYLVAQWHGVDIFKAGSGNPGATNVKRVCGKRAGNLVFALDALKGAIAAAWPLVLPVEPPLTSAIVQIVGLAAAIVGHSFSIFTRFKGGKGVATTLGGAIALMPVSALIAAVVWLVLFYTTRYVSVASIGLAVALPIAAYFRHGLGAHFYFAAALAVFVIYRHRGNVQRLVRGTENRFPPKSGGGGAGPDKGGTSS